MKLHESSIYKEMESSSKTSKSPLKGSFCNLKNLKVVVLVLFGAVAGQGVVWYTSQFYALFFLTQTLKMDAVAANIFIAIAFVSSIFGYIFFGWLSDKIKRKPIVLTGCFLAALTYYPLFIALTHFSNPDLEYTMSKNPAVVIADCSFQFVSGELKGRVKFTSSCDLLNFYSISYSNEEALRGSLAIMKFGNNVSSVSIQGMTPEEASYVQGNLTENVKQAIIDASYPFKADPSKDKVILIILTTFAMAYSPLVAWLIEFFSTKIRYTSMSLPYHIGNGWIGGFLPTVGFAVVLLSERIYAGLWYPIMFASLMVVIGALFLPETMRVDITEFKLKLFNMNTSEIRAVGWKIIRNMVTMRNATENNSFNIFQTFPATNPLPKESLPLFVDISNEKEKIYQKRLEEVISRLKSSPNFNKVAEKIHPISASPRSIVVEMTVDREHLNNKGTLHGGQTSALVDIVTVRAVAVAHKNVPMASTDLSVSYFLPVRIGEILVIEGTVLKAGRTMAFTEIEFRRKSDNALIAKGKHNLVFVPIPADKLNNLEPYY